MQILPGDGIVASVRGSLQAVIAGENSELNPFNVRCDLKVVSKLVLGF